MHAVKIYTAEWCAWCKRTKEWLDEHKIKYKEIDVEAVPGAGDELVSKSGQMGIPVVEIDGKIITGFNPDEMKKALKIK